MSPTSTCSDLTNVVILSHLSEISPLWFSFRHLLQHIRLFIRIPIISSHHIVFFPLLRVPPKFFQRSRAHGNIHATVQVNHTWTTLPRGAAATLTLKTLCMKTNVHSDSVIHSTYKHLIRSSASPAFVYVSHNHLDTCYTVKSIVTNFETSIYVGQKTRSSRLVPSNHKRSGLHSRLSLTAFLV